MCMLLRCQSQVKAWSIPCKVCTGSVDSEKAWQLLLDHTAADMRRLPAERVTTKEQRAALRSAVLVGSRAYQQRKLRSGDSCTCCRNARSTICGQEYSCSLLLQVAAGSAYPAAGWDPGAQPSTLLLGILSGDVRLAVRALRDYTGALGAAFVVPESRVLPCAE